MGERALQRSWTPRDPLRSSISYLTELGQLGLPETGFVGEGGVIGRVLERLQQRLVVTDLGEVQMRILTGKLRVLDQISFGLSSSDAQHEHGRLRKKGSKKELSHTLFSKSFQSLISATLLPLQSS